MLTRAHEKFSHWYTDLSSQLLRTLRQGNLKFKANLGDLDLVSRYKFFRRAGV